ELFVLLASAVERGRAELVDLELALVAVRLFVAVRVEAITGHAGRKERRADRVAHLAGGRALRRLRARGWRRRRWRALRTRLVFAAEHHDDEDKSAFHRMVTTTVTYAGSQLAIFS